MKKVLLIGAGVIGIVVLVGSVLLYANRDKISSFAMDRALSKIEPQVLQHLPDPQVADAVRKDLDSLRDKLHSGKVTTEEIKELAALFYNNLKDGKLDTVEVKHLTSQIHALAGRQ